MAYLFLISNPGVVVDISGFLKEEEHNILYDFNDNFRDLGLVTNCAIIELDNGEIDTIINVTNENIVQIELENNSK